MMINNIKVGFGLLLFVVMVLAVEITNAQTTVNLTARVAAPSQQNVVVRWYTDATHTNSLANPASVASSDTPTNYWAFLYDPTNDCYSKGSKVTIVNAPCLARTFNLSSLSGANTDGLVWHSASVPGTNTLVTDPTKVGEGTYWAFLHDSVAGCYSKASQPVIVTANDDCCKAGNVGPVVNP